MDWRSVICPVREKLYTQLPSRLCPPRPPCCCAFIQGWGLSDIEVPALLAWMEKCRAKESVAFTLKDPAVWAELYKKFLGANYFVRAGVAKK